MPKHSIKVIIEKHKDGYLAYPLDLKGIVVGEGNTYDEAFQDLRSAIRSHLENFGTMTIDRDEAPLEVFIAETEVP